MKSTWLIKHIFELMQISRKQSHVLNKFFVIFSLKERSTNLITIKNYKIKKCSHLFAKMSYTSFAKTFLQTTHNKISFLITCTSEIKRCYNCNHQILLTYCHQIFFLFVYTKDVFYLTGLNTNTYVRIQTLLFMVVVRF